MIEELPRSSRSLERCKGSRQHRGVYSSSSCPLFLLCFVARGYCQMLFTGRRKRGFVLNPLQEPEVNLQEAARVSTTGSAWGSEVQ